MISSILLNKLSENDGCRLFLLPVLCKRTNHAGQTIPLRRRGGDYGKSDQIGPHNMLPLQYPVQNASHGTVVQVCFDPFDLSEVYIYDGKNHYLETISPTKKVTDTAPNIPEESRLSSKKVSQQSVALFSRLREKHRKQLKKARQMPF